MLNNNTTTDKTNKFSAPLPFSKEQIDYLAQMNEKYKKSKVTTLYNCLPYNSIEKSGYEQHRTWDERVNSLYDLAELVNYAKSIGFGFTYLLNTVNTPLFKEFERNVERLNSFLDKLRQFNITDIRVSNTFIMKYIDTNYKEFNLYGSTSQEYSSIRQYYNLIACFPKLKGIVFSWDNNKNFKLIDSFNKNLGIELELMVNEGCVAGCPFRRDHHSSNNSITNSRYSFCFNNLCRKISNGNKSLQLCLDNIIYPWDIKNYNKHNVYNFKFVGRNADGFINGFDYLSKYSTYLKGVDDVESIMDEPIINFNNYLIGYSSWSSLKVKDVINLLPRIEHFERDGYKCSSVCGIECRYCYNCAEKIEKILKKKGLNNGLLL